MVPNILIGLCLGVAWYLVGTIRRTPLVARRISMVFPLTVCLGYALFYVFVQMEVDRTLLANVSRWLLLGTLSTFIIQAWAIRRIEEPVLRLEDEEL